jgi:hypothetical protein
MAENKFPKKKVSKEQATRQPRKPLRFSLVSRGWQKGNPLPFATALHP